MIKYLCFAISISAMAVASITLPVDAKAKPKPDVSHGVVNSADCSVGQRKRGGPKGAVSHGIQVQDLLGGVDKGAVSSDAQGCIAIDPVPISARSKGPKERDKIQH